MHYIYICSCIAEILFYLRLGNTSFVMYVWHGKAPDIHTKHVQSLDGICLYTAAKKYGIAQEPMQSHTLTSSKKHILFFRQWDLMGDGCHYMASVRGIHLMYTS